MNLTANEPFTSLLPSEQAALMDKPAAMQAKYMKARQALLASENHELFDNLAAPMREHYHNGLAGGLNDRQALFASNVLQLIEDLGTDGNAPFRKLYMLAGIYDA